jgi:hypothetical protein
MTINEPTATELWQARQVASITVSHAHRVQADADRDLVEKLTREVARLIEERDQALYERDAAMRLYELDRESVEFARGLIPTQLGDSDGR